MRNTSENIERARRQLNAAERALEDQGEFAPLYHRVKIAELSIRLEALEQGRSGFGNAPETPETAVGGIGEGQAGSGVGTADASHAASDSGR